MNMAEQLVLHDCPPMTRDAVREYWQRKERRLMRLLAPIPADQRYLRLSMRRQKERWVLRLVLLLPTGTLVADEWAGAHDWRAALDRLTDRVVLEIRRHKERLRHDDLYRRKRRRQNDFAQAQAALDSDQQQEQQAAFLELLRPLLRGIAEHARRELTLAQLDGSIRPGELTVSDLLDEVATRAWKGYAQRPRDVSMDQWLVRLLHEVLDEYQAEPAAESLYERIPPDDARYHVDGGWLAENEPFFEPQTPLTLYETLPDHELPEPWQEVAAEEQRQWILNQLRRLPRPMRRAFTLHVLEGWDEADIAMLQDRSVDEVRQDIQTARQTLRQSLESAGGKEQAEVSEVS